MKGFSQPRGNSGRVRHAALDNANRVNEGEQIRILAGFERRFVHQPAHRKMRHQQTIELLLDQFRRLAPHHDLRPAQKGLEFIERRLDLPALVVQSRQFFGRSLGVVEDGSDQAINRLGAGQIVQVIILDSAVEAFPYRMSPSI